jgi:DNA-binding IclR family transcriptional regulator
MSTDQGPPAAGSQTIATVERAADVLTMFARSTEPTLGVTEISQSLGLSKAAVHRILASLRGRSFVELDEDTRRYSLGHASFELGLSYLSRIDVRALAAPELAWLSRETQETATLSVLAGEGRIYVDQVTPPREIVMSVPLGQRFPLHAGSSSKALLAFLPTQEVEQYLARRLEPLTASTRTEPADLREDLAGVRSRGYATSAGERQAGATSVAAPVFDHGGRPVASISVCGPAERLAEQADEAAALLLAATERISLRLGHRPGAA